MVLALSATPVLGQVGDGSIDMFPFAVDPNTGNPVSADPDFGACQVFPTAIFGGFGQKIIIGVYARLSGTSLAGISGAQLYISGLENLPAPWAATVTYPAGTTQSFGATSLIAPRDVGGVPNRGQISTWSVSGPDDVDCQKAALTKIAQIDLLATGGAIPSLGLDRYVSVVKTNPQIGPLDCPLFLQCDFPFFTQFCVAGGQLIINPDQFSCSVAVEETDWGTIKGLYR